MIDLKETTFIIPVYVESNDRYQNAISVLGYLNHHFKTNIIIHEIINGESKLDFLGELTNLNIKHITEPFKMDIYHRTRQLNEMLNLVTTPVVVNYDIDVLLPVESYVESQSLILNGEYDVVYPYEESTTGQVRVFKKFDRNVFNKKFDLNLMKTGDYNLWSAKCGHCMFLNTKKYIESGGENEQFIAYGPEDSERYERFHKIGYKITRIKKLVYHFEHDRTPTSNGQNKYFIKNKELYKNISKMDKDDLINYYLTIDYKNKYSKFN